MQTAKEIYSQSVAEMTASEQLRLATFILEGLSSAGVLDYRDHWSDEDIHDLTKFSMKCAASGVVED